MSLQDPGGSPGATLSRWHVCCNCSPRVPSRVHRLVRPVLDGLSLLVFLLALASAAWHAVTASASAGPSKLSETRHALSDTAEHLLHLERDRPGSIDAVLAAPLPALRLASLDPMRRLPLSLDGWDRPLVFTRLDDEWLVEVRSRGYDAILHTDDDEYARIDRDGRVRSRHDLERPPDLDLDETGDAP